MFTYSIHGPWPAWAEDDYRTLSVLSNPPEAEGTRITVRFSALKEGQSRETPRAVTRSHFSRNPAGQSEPASLAR